MIKSLLSFSEEDLCEAFAREKIITPTQRKILEELVLVLDNFQSLTALIQTGNKSLSYVLPSN